MDKYLQKNNSEWINFIDADIRKKIVTKIEEIIDIFVRTKTYPKRFSLMMGELGVILFLFYSSETFKNNAYYDLAFKKLSSFLQSISSNLNSYTFCDGLAGIGWTVTHLTNEFLEDQNTNDIITDDIDKKVRTLIRTLITN